MPQASKIWTKANNPNKMECSTFDQKGVIYFWQSVYAILEDVSVAKGIVWWKNINLKTSIFHCSKIYGNPTNVTN